MPLRPPNNSDFLNVLNTAITPLTTKISNIEDRTRDMITRADIDKLRLEIEIKFAQPNALEPRLKSIDELKNDMDDTEKS